METKSKKMNRESNAFRKQQNPVAFPRTIRSDVRVLNTTCKAGVVMPAAFIPVLPMDAVMSSRLSIVCRMEETEKMLANAVHIRAHAYFVSMAALERFDGLDSVAFSLAQREGAPDYVDKYTYVDATHGGFYKAFGEHIKAGEEINSLYVEAYNRVVTYRRQQVSISLPERTATDHTLARCLWGETALARVVPDFDAALIEGAFPLNVIDGDVRAKNLRVADPAVTGGARTVNADGTLNTSNTASQRVMTMPSIDANTVNNIIGELTDTGITASLANIELAKKTQAFAALRQTYAGNDDELIDLLMKGVEIPNNAYRDPMHLGTGKGVFGMQQRFATDAANLDQYVANGLVRIDVPFRLPQQSTGGVIVLTYEIVPEPVFDRQADLFLRDEFEDLPDALRDHLDTQPVDVVPNRFVDARHGTPDGTFGYAPMNYDWVRKRVAVGGRFYRLDASDPSAEDQQHIWSVRSVNPVLNDDTFLVPEGLSHNVFRDTELDPFFVQVQHVAQIEGLTQFGPTLYEAQGDYEAVAAIAPMETIDPTV